jgi:hypothetical protein
MEVHLMRVTAALFALLVSLPGVAIAQLEWEPYVSRQDGFVLNFPGQPTISETTWKSQLGYTLPARVYSAERNNERFSITVVDYISLEEQGIARWKQCPPGNSQCRDGGPTIGPGYWKQDERGAMAFAASRYMKDPKYEITDYAWDWQDMVEGFHLQLKNEGRRTLVYIAMHERKLYILEASNPERLPEPGIFTQSMGYLDKEGKRIRYTETVYSNSYHGLGVYPRPAARTSTE